MTTPQAFLTPTHFPSFQFVRSSYIYLDGLFLFLVETSVGTTGAERLLKYFIIQILIKVSHAESRRLKITIVLQVLFRNRKQNHLIMLFVSFILCLHYYHQLSMFLFLHRSFVFLDPIYLRSIDKQTNKQSNKKPFCGTT